MAIQGLLSIAAAGATGAGGSWLGKKASDKRRLERMEPPERKFANSIMQLMAARALSGRKSAADMMEEARMRSELERRQGLEASDVLRQYGMAGAESPGMMNRLSGMRSAGLTDIMNMLNQANLERRRGAVGIANTLLGQNQPYVEETVKEGPMWAKMLSSALPAMGGAAGGMGAKSGGGNTQIMGNALQAGTAMQPQTPAIDKGKTMDMGGVRQMQNAPPQADEGLTLMGKPLQRAKVPAVNARKSLTGNEFSRTGLMRFYEGF